MALTSLVVVDRGSGGLEGRAAAGPRRGLLELAGHLDEHVLPAVGRYQLDADRQGTGCPVQGEAHRGLAGHVELRGVGDEAGDPPALLLRPRGGEPAKLGSWGLTS